MNCKLNTSRGLVGSTKQSKLHQELLKAFPGSTKLNKEGGSIFYDKLFEDKFIEFYGEWFKTDDEKLNERKRKFYAKAGLNKQLFDDLGEPKLYYSNNSYYFVNYKEERFYLNHRKLTKQDHIETVNSLAYKYLNNKKDTVPEFVKKELETRRDDISDLAFDLEQKLENDGDIMTDDEFFAMSNDVIELKRQFSIIEEDILNDAPTFESIVKSVEGTLSPFNKQYLDDLEEKESDEGLENNDDVKNFTRDSTEVRDSNNLELDIVKILSSIPLIKTDVKGDVHEVKSHLLDLQMAKNPNEVKNKIIAITSNTIELALSEQDELLDPFDLMIEKLNEFGAENKDQTVIEFHDKVIKKLSTLSAQDQEAFKNKFVKSFYLSQNIFVITEVSTSGNKTIMRIIDPSNSQDKISLISNNIAQSIFNNFAYSKKKITNEKDLEAAYKKSISIDSRQKLVDLLNLLKIKLSDETISKLYSNRKNVLKGFKTSETQTLEELFDSLFNDSIRYRKDSIEGTEKKDEAKGLEGILEALSYATPEERNNIYKEFTNKATLSPISVLSTYESKNKDEMSDSSLYVGSKQRWVYSLVSHINKEILNWKAGNKQSLLDKSHKNLSYVRYLLALDIEAENREEESDKRIANLDLVINSEIKTINDNNPTAHKEIGEVDLHMDIFFKMFNTEDTIYDTLEKTASSKKSLSFKEKKKNIYINNFSADKSSSYGLRGIEDLPANCVVNNSSGRLAKIGPKAENIFKNYLIGEYNSLMLHSGLIKQFISTNKKDQQAFLMTKLVPEFHYVTKVKLSEGEMKFDPETMKSSVYDAKGKLVKEVNGLMPEFVNNAHWNKFGIFNSTYNNNKESFKVLFKNDGGYLLADDNQTKELEKISKLLINEIIEIAESDKQYLDELTTVRENGNSIGFLGKETNIRNSHVNSRKYDYIVNSIINNIEMFSLFNGDIAFYKQKTNILSMEDALKRGPEIFTDGLYIRRANDTSLKESKYTTYNNETVLVDKNKYGVAAVMNPIENKESKNQELINAAYGNKLNYKHELADAAGYITLDFYKRIISGIYGWTKNDEIIFNRLNDKNYKYTDEDIRWLKQAGRSSAPLKMTFFNMEKLYDENNILVGEYPVYFKYSAAVLAPSIINGNDLESLSNRMNKNGVDQVVFKSGSKDSNRTTTTIHNEENGVFTGLKKEKDIKLNPFTFNLSGLKLQVELPTKFDKENTIGTQHTKNLLANIDMVSNEKNYVLPNHVTGKNRVLTGKEIVEEFEKTTLSILQDQLDKAIKDFGIEKKGSGYTFDQSKLRKIITSQLDVTTEQDLIDVLSDTDLPIESVPGIAQRIFPVISGYIHKNVGKIRTNTGSVIQMANIGFDRISDRDANDIIYLSEDTELTPPLPVTDSKGNILYFDEDGNSFTEKAEGRKMRISNAKVMLPFASIQKETKMSCEELKLAIETGKIDMRIFENIIGYRIPNQSISSNDAIQVVGILPLSMGDSAIVYGEITAKTGSDFDIDKMYLMMPNFEVEEKTKRVIYSDGNNNKGRQNKLIEIMRSILNSHTSYDDLMSPLDDVVVGIKDIIIDIAYKKELAKNPNLTKLAFEASRKKSPLTQMSAVNMVKSRVDMLQAKKLVATMANHMTDIPMSQIVGQLLKYDIGLGTSDFSRKFAVGEENNNEYKLTKITSYLMNAAVDAAKDNYIIDGNFIGYTANAAMVMIRMGVHPENAFKVLMNDDIMKLSRIKQLQTQKTTDIIAEEYAEEKMIEYAKDFVSYIKDNKLDFNDFINNSGKLNDKLILGFWHILQIAGKELNNEIVISKSDSNGAGKNITEHHIQYNRLERLKRDSIGSQVNNNFTRGLKLFKNGVENHDLYFSEELNTEELTFLGAMMNNSLFLTNLLTKNMFIENTDSYREIVNKVLNQLGDELSVSEDNIKTISKAIYPYILSKSNHRIYNINAQELLEEMPKRLKDKRIKYNNKFLNELYIDASTEIISFPGSKFYDANAKMILKEAFSNLYKEDPIFAEELIKYSFLTTGFKPTYFAFNEYLPIDYFINSGHGKMIQKLIDSLNYESNYKEPEFLQDMMTFLAINNTNNYKIVRTIKGDFNIKDNIEIKGDKFKKMLTDKKTGNYNKFIRKFMNESEVLYMLTDIVSTEKKDGTVDSNPVYRKINHNVNSVGKSKFKTYNFNTLKKENLFVSEDKFAELFLSKEKEYISELTKIFDKNNWNIKNDSVDLSAINQMNDTSDKELALDDIFGKPIEVKQDNQEEQDNCNVPF